MTILSTDRLLLLSCDADRLRVLIEGGDAFESAYGLRLAEGWLEAPEALPWFLSRAEALHGTPDAEWSAMRLCVLEDERLVVGACGFKGAPSPEGEVELGYGIATAYRRQGYATEAAQALVAYALADPRVRTVTAHTLPAAAPSASVLRKCGFRFDGEREHPEEGRVWRWSIGG